MDENTRKYIDINLIQNIMTYEGADKKEVKTKRVFPVVKCTSDYFETDYEKKFWSLNEDGNLMCVEDKKNEIYMQGTRDSRV